MAKTKTTKFKGGAPEEPAPESTETLFTLPQLVARLGEVTEAEVHHFVEGLTKAQLIEAGSEVATSRIDTDAARLYGKVADFFDGASDAQLDLLVGVSKNMLRAAVWSAHKGSLLASAREKAITKAGSSKQARAGEALTLRAKAVARRKMLRLGLRSLAAGNAQVLDRIEVAHGVITTAQSVADSLDALVKVGRDLLKAPSASMKVRLADARLTKPLLDETAQLAKDVRAAGDAADAVVGGGAVSQADVDYWDGINLYFLTQLIDVFGAAHEADPTVPRLVPISLRTYFTPARRRAPEPAPPGGAPGPVVPA